MVRFFFMSGIFLRYLPYFSTKTLCSSYEVPEKSYITEMILLSQIFTFYVFKKLANDLINK